MSKKSAHGISHISSPEDLPQAIVERRSRNHPHRPCPRCGRSCYRDKRFSRRLHDLGDIRSGRPRDIELVYSQHYCVRCKSYFSTDTSDLALPKSEYTHRVMSLALRLVIEDGMPYQGASWRLWRDHLVFVPFATIQNWVEDAGKKKS